MSQEYKRRRDAGALQVTERDSVVLRWIAEQYCISYDHLRHLLALYTSAITKDPTQVAYSTAMNAVTRWLQLGFIEQPHKITRELPSHIWLSRKGISQLELPYSYYQPKAGSVRHFYAVNAIRLSLQSYSLSALWKPQRLLHRETTTAPLPDAELQAQHVPLLAVQVIERPNTPNFMSEEEKTLFLLLKRYEKIWYFLHGKALVPFSHFISTLPHQERDRIVIFGLDAKEVQVHETSASLP